MKKIKLIIVLVILIAAAVFAFQNVSATNIKFLIYTFNISKSLLVLISAFTGFLIGIIVTLLLRKRRA